MPWHRKDRISDLLLFVSGRIFAYRQLEKYFSGLFLFSLISEVPFDLAVFKSWYDFSSQNVFFTLWIALLVLAGMKYVSEKQ